METTMFVPNRMISNTSKKDRL